MKVKKMGTGFALRIDRGEELVATLLAIAAQNEIQAASVTAIGAADQVLFGVYNVAARSMTTHTMEGDLELTAVVGDLTRKDGAPYAHLHVTLGDEAGNAYGGHLVSARISGTCELFLQVLPGEIRRKLDDATGLQVMDWDE